MSATALPMPLSSPPADSSRTLMVGIGVSVLLHAVLLSLHFQFPDASRALQDKALDIILVNAKSKRPPSDAQALAQNNLDGGGNTEQNRRAKTPLPPAPEHREGSELERKQRRIEELEAKQRALLSQAQKSRASTPKEAREASREAPLPTPTSGKDLASSALAMARTLGEIDRQIDDYNKMPRKQFIGARTSEYRFARYVEDWRLKVEKVGTLNYPDAAKGRTYGTLVMTVVIRPDGTVQEVELNRPSGFKVLDDAARRIVQLAGPYAPFPPDIRRDTDLLYITRTWSFTQGDQLQSK
ncbi:periplasmic protein TonB [Oryzomicrobium terrae]|uniref:Periplasmic protein TonB n=1 Tax=Oryzomicrobium terrae TaxID=1735038 RepID=A0A5C1EBC1_9RHOO|nr:TonB family protein [Oryzomicrobium terrae]QEL66301.1 periplasmic protein TonB [Oryzomicrobium terrae]